MESPPRWNSYSGTSRGSSQGKPFQTRDSRVCSQFEPEDDENGALSLNSNSTIKGFSFHLDTKIMENGGATKGGTQSDEKAEFSFNWDPSNPR